MIINEIPLQNLKDILATDTPLAIETTESLIERLEVLGRRLDAMRRQRDGFMHDAQRKQKALEQAEAQVSRVRAVAHTIPEAWTRKILHALDGEPNE